MTAWMGCVRHHSKCEYFPKRDGKGPRVTFRRENLTVNQDKTEPLPRHSSFPEPSSAPAGTQATEAAERGLKVAHDK